MSEHDDGRGDRQANSNDGRQGDAEGGGARPDVEAQPGTGDVGAGGEGSFGGQASDNDYGNRGVTESGNFRNYETSDAQPGSEHDAPAGEGGAGKAATP